MASYELSKAWHIAHTVAVDIHALAVALPKADYFNTHQEIRRASATVPLQIQASIDKHPKDQLKHFLDARHAAVELHEILMLAKEYEYIEKQLFEDLAQRTIAVQQLLTGLIRSY